MSDAKAKRAFKNAQQKDLPFRRGEMFNKELMEDFRFMEAARMASGEYEAADLTTGHLKPRSRFKELMVTNPHGLINFAAYSHRLTKEDDNNRVVEADIRSLRFETRMAKYPPLDIFAHWLLNTTFFKVVMIFVIIINSALIALDLEFDQSTKTNIPLLRRSLDDMDVFFLLMFLSEIVLKFLDDFRGFWNEGWNIFDFLVTVSVRHLSLLALTFVCMKLFGVLTVDKILHFLTASLPNSLVPLVLDITLSDAWADKEEDFETIFQVVRYLRILRIFRSLNVVTRIAKIRLIWHAVLKTFRELFFITVLMGLFFYIFAIIGMKLFEAYSSSHRIGLKYRVAFKNLPLALVTLFQLFTLDHYEDLMKDMVQVEGQDRVYPFVITWIFLGSFIFRNIFTGVMVNNFQTIQQELMEEEAEIEQHKQLAIELDVFGEDLKSKDGKSNSREPHLGWEEDVFHNMKIIEALQENLSPTVWPRDTLFQYYTLLEALASNLEEKNQIMRLLDNALVHHFDP